MMHPLISLELVDIQICGIIYVKFFKMNLKHLVINQTSLDGDLDHIKHMNIK